MQNRLLNDAGQLHKNAPIQILLQCTLQQRAVMGMQKGTDAETVQRFVQMFVQKVMQINSQMLVQLSVQNFVQKNAPMQMICRGNAERETEIVRI